MKQVPQVAGVFQSEHCNLCVVYSNLFKLTLRALEVRGRSDGLLKLRSPPVCSVCV